MPPAVHHNDNPYRLSNREIEVLQLVAAGHSNKEIGETLNLSALTIRSHLMRTGRKLGTGNRAQLTRHPRRPDPSMELPAQLPPSPAHFTGRTTELAALDDVLATAETSGSVTICVIAGTAGIGKTVLAVY